MSQNPYQSEPGFEDGAFTAEYEQPPRTSFLAIASALLAIPCCIPGAGLLAAVLGGVSLGIIRNAHGRLSGRVAAIIGIFLGLFVTVLQLGLGIGAMQAYAFWTNTMAPSVNQLVVSTAQGDITTARAVLTADANADLTDDQLALFVSVIEAEAGPIKEVGTRFEDVFNAFGRAYKDATSSTQTFNANPSNSNATPAPFAILCDNGTVLCWAIFDSTTLDKGKTALLVDLMVMVPGGKAVTLRTDAEAAEIALTMSAQTITAQEAINAANAVEQTPANTGEDDHDDDDEAEEHSHDN
jgi:hypothetical protein